MAGDETNGPRGGPREDPDSFLRGPDEPPEIEPPSLYKSAWILYQVLAVGAVLWLGARHGALPLEIFLVPARVPADLAWGLGAGVVLLGLWKGAATILPGARRLEEAMRQLIGRLDASEALALALISGFAEEIFFRGAMQQSWGFWPTVICFALLHTGPGRVFLWWTAFAAVAGILFGWLVTFRGTLLPVIVAHVLVNGVNLYRLAVHEIVEADGDAEA